VTPALTTWLAFVAAAGAIVWFAPRAWLPFVVVAVLTLPAVFMTLGHPTHSAPPQGEYAVYGGLIEKDVAIYVLIGIGADAPRYYRLPYSEKAAGEMQRAMDGAKAHNGRVKVRVGQSGAVGFAETVPQPEDPKQPETPIIGG